MKVIHLNSLIIHSLEKQLSIFLLLFCLSLIKSLHRWLCFFDDFTFKSIARLILNISFSSCHNYFQNASFECEVHFHRLGNILLQILKDTDQCWATIWNVTICRIIFYLPWRHLLNHRNFIARRLLLIRLALTFRWRVVEPYRN